VSSCHIIISALTTIGHFLLLARLSVTRCPVIFEIRNVRQTFLDSYGKCFCSGNIIVSSALEILTIIAFYITLHEVFGDVHDWYDVRPTITFLATQHHCLPLGRYLTVLLCCYYFSLMYCSSP